MKTGRFFILMVGCLLVVSLRAMDEGAAAPVVPAAAAPVPVQAEAPTEWRDIVGTESIIDEGRGDWYKKKQIGKKARVLYQEIGKRVAAVHKEAQALDDAYLNDIRERTQPMADFPVDEVAIDKVVLDLNEQIQQASSKDRRQDTDRQALVDLNDNKKLVESFKEEVAYLGELQKGMNAVVALLATQRERCTAFEKNAWRLYETIDAALNDQIAQRLYEEMQTLAENVDLIATYVHRDLRSYITTTIKEFDVQKGVVLAAYKQLMERGFFVPEQQPSDLVTTATAIKAEQEHGLAWWQWIFYPFTALWHWFIKLFGY